MNNKFILWIMASLFALPIVFAYPQLYGDCSGNGVIDSPDLACIKDLVGGMNPVCYESVTHTVIDCITIMDLNDDGSFTQTDTDIVKGALARVITQLDISKIRIGELIVVCPDHDNDGFGSGAGSNNCIAANPSSIPAGYADNSDDCNDNPSAGGSAIHPGATEIPNNGIDEDCSGADSVSGGTSEIRVDDFEPSIMLVISIILLVSFVSAYISYRQRHRTR